MKNSYVASQSFDRDRAAQQALNWTVTAEYDGQEMVLTIRDETGYPAPVKDLQATVGRPTHMRDDQTPEFQLHEWRVPRAAAAGLGGLEHPPSATAQDGTVSNTQLNQ